MELSYFDIIPKEITYLILFNIEDVEDIMNLSQISIFEEISNDNIFWEQKVRYEFLGVICINIINRKIYLNIFLDTKY